MPKENQLKIGDVTFPVVLKPIFVEDNASLVGEYAPVPGFKAVMAEDNRHIFSVVAQDYRLVTNEEALQFGKICFGEIFKALKAEEMVLFNIIMPKTRSFCHVDFVHPKATFNFAKDDSWTPYIRITNSYNRMFALNFDLGFCRWICMNGVIFGKKNIEFKFYHSKSATDPVAKFKLKAGELATLEAQFIAHLNNITRFHVPTRVMWPLACKVFGFSLHDAPTERQEQMMEERKTCVRELTNRYFKELGENGYAALNVLTDYASRPVGVIAPEMNIDALQRKSGEWILDFVAAIEARDFSFDKYLGDYAKHAA
jgi:hypothetical protein